MIIGACTIELRIPGNGSLKGKRRVLKSLMGRVRKEFNVSIAEVDCQDVWQTAVLGVVCVSNGAGYVHSLLTKVVNWIERNRINVEVVDYRIEVF